MTEFDPSGVPPREDFDAEPDLAELLAKARELARALPERARADPGAPFEPESLDAAALMYRHDRPAFERLREALRGKSNLRDWQAEVKRAVPKSTATIGGEQYLERDGALVWMKPTRDGEVPTPITNFMARLAEQVTLDDGAETMVRYLVAATFRGRDYTLPVLADQFDALRWLFKINARAYVTPNMQQRAAVAIRELSEGVVERTVFGHTGWRQTDGRWLFLHAKGALGAHGPVDGVECSPYGGRLEIYALPAPPSGERLRAAFRACARLPTLFPDRPEIGMAMLAAIFRAPFGWLPCTIVLVGSTGAGKTETAALALRAYAPEATAKTMPAGWHDTPTDIEGKMFAARDVVIVIDDHAPDGDRSERRRNETTVGRVFRMVGNHKGRGRSRADLTGQPDRPPMGVVIATMEHLPLGASNAARALILEAPLGGVDLAALTELQRAAADGLLAEAVAFVIKLLAGDRDRWVGLFRQNREGLEIEARRLLPGAHGRTPDNIADLAAGLATVLEVPEIGELWEPLAFDLIWRMLLAAGEMQAKFQCEADPARMFIAMIEAALASGEAHLSPAGRPDDQPNQLVAGEWGWRKTANAHADREGDNDLPRFVPSGKRIGWAVDIEGSADAGLLFLQPDAAYAMAEGIAAKQGRSLGIGPRALWQLLGERELLTRRDPGRSTYKKKIGDGPQNTICVNIWNRQLLYSRQRKGTSGTSGDGEAFCRFQRRSPTADHSGPVPDSSEQPSGSGTVGRGSSQATGLRLCKAPDCDQIACAFDPDGASWCGDHMDPHQRQASTTVHQAAYAPTSMEEDGPPDG